MISPSCSGSSLEWAMKFLLKYTAFFQTFEIALIWMKNFLTVYIFGTSFHIPSWYERKILLMHLWNVSHVCRTHTIIGRDFRYRCFRIALLLGMNYTSMVVWNSKKGRVGIFQEMTLHSSLFLKQGISQTSTRHRWKREERMLSLKYWKVNFGFYI